MFFQQQPRALRSILENARSALSWKRDLALWRERKQRAAAVLERPAQGDPVLQAAHRSLEDGLYAIAEESLGRDVCAETRLSMDSWLRRHSQSMLNAEPATRLDRLLEQLFKHDGFRAERDLSGQGRLDNLLLTSVWHRRAGHCLGLSSVILLLARRLDLPIHAISGPGHVLLFEPGAGEKPYLETTASGLRCNHEEITARLTKRGRGGDLTNLSDLGFIAEVLNNRSHDSWIRGFADDAFRDLRRAMRLNPIFARGHAARGFMALCQGDLPFAIKELARALELDQNSAIQRQRLGEALLESARVDEAILHLRAATELDPSSGPAWSILARALLQRRRIEEARQAHREALRLAERDALAWTNWGVFLAVTGSISESLDAFMEALELNPDLLAPAENIVLLARQGKLQKYTWILDELLASAEARLNEEPENGARALVLARLLSSIGSNAERARQLAERARRRLEHPAAYELLAIDALSNQHYALARQRILQGLDRSPAARTRAALLNLLKRVDSRLSSSSIPAKS